MDDLQLVVRLNTTKAFSQFKMCCRIASDYEQERSVPAMNVVRASRLSTKISFGQSLLVVPRARI